jgi:Flp pilus assembly protein TadD
VTQDELQALIDDATFDHVSGDSAAALEKLGRATSLHPESAEAWHAAAEINLGQRRLDAALEAGERALSLRKSDPLIIATLSRIWMERGDKARAEHFGAMARMQGWKDELSSPLPPDAGGLR